MPGQLHVANPVFLVDVSGLMNSPARLPLRKSSLQLLTRQLTAADRVSMVVYAGSSGVVLEPTPGTEQLPGFMFMGFIAGKYAKASSCKTR